MLKYKQITGKYNRTIVVGDIHGCIDELYTLLGKVGFNDGDLLVAVGDIVDRGPDSWGVASFFRSTPNAYCCKGNHERRVAGTILGTCLPAWTQRQTIALLPHDERLDWAEWFAALPLVIETPHCIVVHAQLDPEHSLDEQVERHVCGVGGPAATIPVNEKGIPVWFRGAEFGKPVCVGHQRYNRVELVPDKLYALDTGTAKGGQLTAVSLPDGRIVNVDADRNYYAEARQGWKLQEIRDSHAALPQKTLQTFTLYEADRLLSHVNNLSRDDEELCDSIRDYLDSYLFNAVEADLRDLLDDRFDEVPVEKKERRAFAKSVISCFPSEAVGQIAFQLLNGKHLTMRLIHQFAPHGLLIEIEEIVQSLRYEIERVCDDVK
jgi:serine/threonine protein phosphatase 1